MAKSKKELELWRLTRFASFISDFPAGEIEPCEEPDFLVRTGNRVVGIEITDLHRETIAGQIPQQASEAMRQRVVNRAKEIYDSRDLPPVMATLFLHDNIHIKKSEVEHLATELADLVCSHIPEPDSEIQIPDDWDDFRELPVLLIQLSVRRLAVITKTFFSSPGATWVGSLEEKDIQRVLDGKEPKQDVYRTKCDETWLVINTDIESMSTWFEFNEHLTRSIFRSDFDRIFLVQHFRGHAHELMVRPKSPNPSFHRTASGGR